jgi:N utilization substance protein B
MNRRKAREDALQILFQLDFTGGKTGLESSPYFLTHKENKSPVKGFTEELVKGTIEHIEHIDRVIEQTAEHWKVERMSAVDRTILRFTVFEILYREDIPSAVTINEALEIAKKYSTAESAPFINGLLDRIAHDSGRA